MIAVIKKYGSMLKGHLKEVYENLRRLPYQEHLQVQGTG